MRLRYQFSESYVPEPQKIDKTGMAHSSAVPAGLSKTVCADMENRPVHYMGGAVKLE